MDNCTIIFIVLLLLALIFSGAFVGSNYLEESDNKRRIQWIIGIITITVFFVLSIVLYCYYNYAKGHGLRLVAKEFDTFRSRVQDQLYTGLSLSSKIISSAKPPGTKS